MMKTSLNLTVSPHIKKAARKYKKLTGESVSALASRLLSEKLEQEGYLAPRKSVAANA
jgi:hypothetical protein